MSSSDPPGVKTNGKPQPFDPEKVKKAADWARQLAIGFGADKSGDEYRRVLEQVVDEAFDGVETEQEFHDRLAYVLYGSALFSFSALGLLGEMTGMTIPKALVLLEDSITAWLAQSKN